jgi:hypothetical protein
MVNRVLLFALLSIMSAIAAYSSEYAEAYEYSNNSGDSLTTRALLRKINSYYFSMRQDIPDTLTTNIYNKSGLQITKRNYFLLTIPNMMRIARHGENNLLRETYGEYERTRRNNLNLKQQYLLQTNVYKRRQIVEKANDIVQMNIYSPTIVDDYFLSPVRQSNKKFYIYHNQKIDNNHIELSFKPKVSNTQLVSGSVIIEENTGKITEYTIAGYHQFFNFKVNVTHGDNGYESILAKKITGTLSMNFLGNHLLFSILNVPNIGIALNDTLVNSSDSVLMERVRPTPLTAEERHILYEDSAAMMRMRKSSHSFGNVMSKIVLRSLFDRVRFNFGKNDQCQLKVGPLMNPFYFGYSGKKGIVYRSKFIFNYDFNDDHNLYIKTVLGYSFKQKQIYATIPVKYRFNKEHNAYVELYLKSGNHITSSALLNRVKEETRDSVDFSRYKIDYFRDIQTRLTGHYEVHPRLGFETGIVYYYRQALNAKVLRELGKSPHYSTFAPTMKVQYTPWGRRGPTFTADYEHAFHGIFGSDDTYDRWEFDAAYQIPMPCMRKIYTRAGAGFYTHKGKDEYFLDYNNFHHNYNIDEWHEDWIGEFELLDANWYNASDFYVRLNTCYESPLLFAALIPKVGKVIEKERIYISALAIRKYYPYVELGYAFTNHIFSLGLFTAFSHKKYEGVGVKFNIEIFDDW